MAQRDIHFDTRDLKRLARDLEGAKFRAQTGARQELRKGAQSIERRWRTNARRTAGRHGKHYPNAIGWEQVGPLAFEVGPDPAKPQGGMSFEYGSRNQPPHLDGNRAADVVFPRVVRAMGEVAERAVGGRSRR